MAVPLRHTPFELNPHARLPAAPHLTPAELTDGIRRLNQSDLVSFVRAYVQERTPAAFSGTPLLWESVRVWLSSRCGVHPREIGLSGSSQVGFSIVKAKNWAPFNPRGSDLDLFLVNPSRYEAVETEARRFVATNASNQRYLDQVRTTERQLHRGWIDVKHIPADHDRYPKVANMKNDASILIDRLKLHSYDLKPSSFRIYSSWQALSDWTSLSYEHLSAEVG